ncbi:MAG: hypothetical protein Q4C49_01405 [Bacillota bacterium]|nr:hypothetical protein [Bacillota bacterium]
MKRKVFALVLVQLFALRTIAAPSFAQDGEIIEEPIILEENEQTEEVIEEQFLLEDDAKEIDVFKEEIPSEEDFSVIAEEEDLIEQEEKAVTWLLDLPAQLVIPYRANDFVVETAKVVNVENLEDQTIYITLTCDCTFAGTKETMPVTIYVDNRQIVPGEDTIIGSVSKEGSKYAQVRLVFTEQGWDALSFGNFSMAISYDTYLG